MNALSSKMRLLKNLKDPKDLKDPHRITATGIDLAEVLRNLFPNSFKVYKIWPNFESSRRTESTQRIV